jgi:hypothetical protein
MRKQVSALFLAAAVLSGVGECAQAPPETAQIAEPVSTDGAPSQPWASTTLRMRGTIGKYDASTRVLSLSTSNGTVQLPLALAARIRRDGHIVAASELENLHGYRAAVRYSESAGNKTVESVDVLDRAKG